MGISAFYQFADVATGMVLVFGAILVHRTVKSFSSFALTIAAAIVFFQRIGLTLHNLWIISALETVGAIGSGEVPDAAQDVIDLSSSVSTWLFVIGRVGWAAFAASLVFVGLHLHASRERRNAT
jgi:hypothetical protein